LRELGGLESAVAFADPVESHAIDRRLKRSGWSHRADCGPSVRLLRRPLRDGGTRGNQRPTQGNGQSSRETHGGVLHQVMCNALAFRLTAVLAGWQRGRLVPFI
jgi:hypothetical protein